MKLKNCTPDEGQWGYPHVGAG